MTKRNKVIVKPIETFAGQLIMHLNGTLVNAGVMRQNQPGR